MHPLPFLPCSVRCIGAFRYSCLFFPGWVCHGEVFSGNNTGKPDHEKLLPSGPGRLCLCLWVDRGLSTSAGLQSLDTGPDRVPGSCTALFSNGFSLSCRSEVDQKPLSGRPAVLLGDQRLDLGGVCSVYPDPVDSPGTEPGLLVWDLSLFSCRLLGRPGREGRSGTGRRNDHPMKIDQGPGGWYIGQKSQGVSYNKFLILLDSLPENIPRVYLQSRSIVVI